MAMRVWNTATGPPGEIQFQNDNDNLKNSVIKNANTTQCSNNNILKAKMRISVSEPIPVTLGKWQENSLQVPSTHIQLSFWSVYSLHVRGDQRTQMNPTQTYGGHRVRMKPRHSGALRWQQYPLYH